MKNQSRSTELPGAPAWFQSSLPSAPTWFQSSAEQIEFESVGNAHRDDDCSTDGPEFDELDTAEAAGTNPRDMKSNAEFERRPSAVTAAELQSIRVRDVMLGGVAATILFAVFSVGFLSRGFMMPTRDAGLQPTVGASEIPVQRPSDAAPSLIAAQSNPAASTVIASVSAPKLPQPNVDDPVETKAAAPPDQPITAVPQLKLPDSLTHSIMAKPTLGGLKMAATQPVSLNLASSTIAAQPATNGQTAQCSGPPQGTLGTRIAWADTPDESWQLARDQSKLVFMMHVSGNFEKPGFT